MKKYLVLSFMMPCFILCCKSKQKNEEVNQPAGKKFFPVADYLQSEIRYVDSLPIGIIKYSVQPNKTDTSYIRIPEFNKIALAFICNELTQENFEKQFSESSFMDQTTHAATFTYSTKNPDLELQRVDVLATPAGNTNNVSTVYLEKVIHRNDTLILKKMLWRTRTSLQIITSTQVSDQKPVVKQVKLVWGVE
jgi:hypothetical protein